MRARPLHPFAPPVRIPRLILALLIVLSAIPSLQALPLVPAPFLPADRDPGSLQVITTNDLRLGRNTSNRSQPESGQSLPRWKGADLDTTYSLGLFNWERQVRAGLRTTPVALFPASGLFPPDTRYGLSLAASLQYQGAPAMAQAVTWRMALGLVVSGTWQD